MVAEQTTGRRPGAGLEGASGEEGEPWRAGRELQTCRDGGLRGSRGGVGQSSTGHRGARSSGLVHRKGRAGTGSNPQPSQQADNRQYLRAGIAEIRHRSHFPQSVALNSIFVPHLLAVYLPQLQATTSAYRLDVATRPASPTPALHAGRSALARATPAVGGLGLRERWGCRGLPPSSTPHLQPTDTSRWLCLWCRPPSPAPPHAPGHRHLSPLARGAALVSSPAPEPVLNEEASRTP